MRPSRHEREQDAADPPLLGGGDPLLSSSGSFQSFATISTKKKKTYTYEELQKIEQRRRLVLRRVELPFWRTLFYWDGTCLAILYKDSLLWATVGLYIAIRVQARMSDMPTFVTKLATANIDVIGGFLSFFLVFFVNQSNTRFQEMYKAGTVTCQQHIYNISSLAATFLPRANALRLVRYLNAAHIASYMGISNTRTYSKRTVFDELNRSMNLLTPQEMMRVNEIDMDHGGDCFRELLAWCMAEARIARKEEHINDLIMGKFLDSVMQLRATMDFIYGVHDQPIHFFYIHFLNLLTVLYLPVFAISNAYRAGVGDEVHWTSDWLSGLIVVLQAVFVIGLRVLGQKMTDPYGDDLEDLSVLYYIRKTWKTSGRILARKCPDPVDAKEEETLKSTKQISLGHPWEPPALNNNSNNNNTGNLLSFT